MTATVDDVRAGLLEVLGSDRALLAAAADDDKAVTPLAERILYRLRVEQGLELVRGRPAYDQGLPLTRDTVALFEPLDCERVAATIEGLLGREPWKSSRGFLAEREVLGSLLVDLRTRAVEAGEPVGVRRDLRDAKTRRDELDAQLRLEAAAVAYDELITEAIAADASAITYPTAEADGASDASVPAAPDADEAMGSPLPVGPAAEPLPSWV